MLGFLALKQVNICRIQETKCDAKEEFCDGYKKFLQKRPNKYHGQNFPVRDSTKIVETDVITDRVCYLTLKKKKIGQQSQMKIRIVNLPSKKEKKHADHRKLLCSTYRYNQEGYHSSPAVL